MGVGLIVVTACASGPRMMTGVPGGMMNGSGTTMRGYHFSPITCTAPAHTTSTVDVVLADMRASSMMGGTAPIGAHMMLHSAPTTLPAGTVTFLAVNRGWRTHELIVLPLGSGSVAGQRSPGGDGKVAETGALGEASSPCGPGPGPGIPAGSASWVTLTLPPGRYELLCNLPNHYADGMHQEFDVT